MTTRLGRFDSAWPMTTFGWSRRLQPHLSSGRMRPRKTWWRRAATLLPARKHSYKRGRGREAVYPTRFHQARRRHGRGRRAARQRPGVRPVRHRRRDPAGPADRRRREPARAAPEQVRSGRRDPVSGEHQEVHRNDRGRGARRQRELGGSAAEDGGRRQCRQRPRHRARVERRSASVPDPDPRPHRRRDLPRPEVRRLVSARREVRHQCGRALDRDADRRLGRPLRLPQVLGQRSRLRRDSGGSGRLPPACPEDEGERAPDRTRGRQRGGRRQCLVQLGYLGARRRHGRRGGQGRHQQPGDDRGAEVRQGAVRAPSSRARCPGSIRPTTKPISPARSPAPRTASRSTMRPRTRTILRCARSPRIPTMRACRSGRWGCRRSAA